MFNLIVFARNDSYLSLLEKECFFTILFARNSSIEILFFKKKRIFLHIIRRKIDTTLHTKGPSNLLTKEFIFHILLKTKFM